MNKEEKLAAELMKLDVGTGTPLDAWLRPLEPIKNWLEEKSASLPKDPTPDPRIAQARELCKVYKKIRVAEILGVSKSTITQWTK
jgi:DNA-binding XRE family transcriptional regulator